MMRILLVVVFFMGAFSGWAQKVSGNVFDQNGAVLPFASLTIKGTTIGSSASNRGSFVLHLSAGKYTIVCQHIGFATQEKEVTLTGADIQIDFILAPQQLTLKEVIVKNNGEDPAYAIIRQTIKKRPEYKEEVKGFTCDLYSKDLIKLRKLPNRILGKKIPDNDRKEMRLDSSGAGIIYLSEAVSSVAFQMPDKLKMQVKSSRVSGSGDFGFTFPTFISFYQNNLSLFIQNLNPRGFISPISDNAIHYYKFKFLGSFWEDGKEISSIRVMPRRQFEPLFSGTINISEGDWHIHSLDLMLTKNSQMQVLDTLKIVQFHVPAGKNVWRVKNQLLHFDFKQLGVDAVGNFVNVYSDYIIDPVFDKKYFDKVVIKYDTGLNKKSKLYWDTIRPIPLEKEEVMDYQVKDSLYEVQRDSAFTQSNIDSLKRKQGKIKLYKVFTEGINRNHYSLHNPYRWGVESIIKNLEYNTAEGVVVNAIGSYRKELKAIKTNLIVSPNLRYGFSNGHLNGWMSVRLNTRNFDEEGSFRRHSWIFSGGSRVEQINKQSPITPLVNSFSTLLYGRNYLKNYENIFGNLGYTKFFESGVKLQLNATYEDRIPLNNTTNFTLFKKDSSRLTPNFPAEKISEQFARHQALLFAIDIQFKPGQKYIQFPSGKVPFGSKYPTFSFNYTKGVPDLLNSQTNFDKWRFSMRDNMNFKLLGNFKYYGGVGGFLNDKKVFIQDYQHFNGNLTVAAGEYVNSFQAISYYGNSTTAAFYAFGHVEHHFNGLLTNKIPLFRRLNWHLLTGSNAFYVNKTNHDIEVFAGLENIFKIFRVDVVAAYVNNAAPITAIRIGLGGVLGSGMQSGGGSSNRF